MQAHIWQFSRCAVVALFCAITHLATAQTTTVPRSKPEPRKLPDNITKGGVSGTGASIVSKPSQSKPVVQQIIYIVISEARQWTSSDGKVLQGKLIAFEQTTETITDASPITSAKPFTPPQITVVRDGKARLLIGNKPFEIPLERLSEPDRELIEKTRVGIAAQTKKAPEKKP
jgi:hypothetical protein